MADPFPESWEHAGRLLVAVFDAELGLHEHQLVLEEIGDNPPLLRAVIEKLCQAAYDYLVVVGAVYVQPGFPQLADAIDAAIAHRQAHVEAAAAAWARNWARRSVTPSP